MSVTSNLNRKLGFSLPPPSPAPFLTPRTERRSLDLRWADGSSPAIQFDKDKEVNVQVVLRCRPLSDEEQRLNVQKAVSCIEQKKEVVVFQNSASKQVEKTFLFDKVFGPKAQQRSIYDYAISPFVKDVLEGYNCTVFAYGQTGTGKTYTMEGEMKFKGGDFSGDAGVIPRAVRHIFDALESQKSDYSMKVTFLELYNEEITDLLVSEEHTRTMDDKQRRPISLMEDGKGGAIIRGLQEEVVYSANDIFNLLERGTAKRRTTDTMLNKQSSRSHSIFSITIHVKEVTLGNGELIKCGRLNLVDLAGSENISKSGVREVRAREAGEMNKSLLTLGRVITALVEHSGHVPYRDSKLTRLLRDSLGGKSKTCIIATISPSVLCLEETLSTLDYAYRAKSIRNKPEANRKVSKSVLLKDLYLEIERMKQDVRAAREKNGVYIPPERFAQDEAERKVMSEKIEQMESNVDLLRKALKFQELYQAEQERNLDMESEIQKCKESSEENKKALQDLQGVYNMTNLMLKEKEFIISNLLQSESAILQRAKQMHSNLESASEDMSLLLAKIERQTKIETENQGLVLNFGSHLDQNLKDLHKTVLGSLCQHQQVLRSMEEHFNSFLAAKSEATRNLERRIAKIKDVYASGVQGMRKLANVLHKKSLSDLEQMKLSISAQMISVENFLITAVSEAEQVLSDVQTSLEEQKELLAFSACQQEMGLKQSLVSTQVISRTTIDFFNDFQERASRLAAIAEENQMERSHQLEVFETKFKELSAKEENAALEKIAGILRNLTSTKDNMVLEALHNMNNKKMEEKKMLQLEMSDMQQVSANVKSELIEQIEKVENQFQENETSAAATRATMENIIQSCSKEVDKSMQYWEVAQLSVNKLNEDHNAQSCSSIEEINQENKNILEEFTSVSTYTDVDFEMGTSSLLTTVKDSHLLDLETSNAMNSKTTICSDQLKLLQHNHSESIKEIRYLADERLLKEYLIDLPTATTPKKSSIVLPGWSSIEELRTPHIADLVKGMESDNRLKSEHEVKHQQYLSPLTSRCPFATINRCE
ncbi:putative plus-end-directed kinesin ATPase [Dioscorea sansibarensis]